MSDITLEGVVYYVPYRSSKVHVQPRVFIDEKDQKKLCAWLRENQIDTNVEPLSHPISHKPCPQIQATSKAKNIKDGTQVKITICEKDRKRAGKLHKGLETLLIESI